MKHPHSCEYPPTSIVPLGFNSIHLLFFPPIFHLSICLFFLLYLLFFVRKIGANAKDNMTKLSRSSESIMIALAILRMTTYPIKTQYVFALDLFQTLFYCMAKFASQSYLTWGWLAGTDKRYDILIYALHSLFAFFCFTSIYFISVYFF